MYSRELVKPDGRRLVLYSRRPIAGEIVAPSASPYGIDANPHLRWHPLRGEWTRDKRKYLAGTEIGAGTFANDALPEAQARELQAVAVPV